MKNVYPGPATTLLAAVAWIVLQGLASPSYAGVQATFVVSPTGSDDAGGTIGAPFRTITKARDAVRAVNQNMTGDIYVYLRGGEYPLTETIRLESRDGGTNGHRVFYAAYQNEVPVLSGGVKITGWSQHTNEIYKAPFDKPDKLRSLYVNDKRAYMAGRVLACTGKAGTYSVSAGQAEWAWTSGSKSDGALFDLNALPDTRNPEDIELMVTKTWTEIIACVRDLGESGGKRVAFLQQPAGAIAQCGNGYVFSGNQVVSNVFEFLDEEGEFYYDKAGKTVYYYRRAGEDMSTAEVFAPYKVVTMLEISGTSLTDRISNVTVRGITFAYSDWQLFEVEGSHCKNSPGQTMMWRAFATVDRFVDAGRSIGRPADAVLINSADGIVFERNVIKHTGADAVGMLNDVSASSVIGNKLYDLGGAAVVVGDPEHVYIGDGGEHAKYGATVEGVCRNDTIRNNFAYDLDRLFHAHTGIHVCFAENLDIEHNHLRNLPYNAISLGWGQQTFDETTAKPSTTSKDNAIRYNIIEDWMQVLHDGGAFYTQGGQPGSVIEGNYCKDLGHKGASGWDVRGWHPDNGTANMSAKNNVFEILDGFYTLDMGNWARQHNLTADNTYSTSKAYNCSATNSKVTNFHFVAMSERWPAEAKAIIDNAGLEPAYRYLLDSDYSSRVRPSRALPPSAEIPVTITRKTAGDTFRVPMNRSAQETVITVYDMSGRRLRVAAVGKRTIDLRRDLRLADGVHIVRIQVPPPVQK